MLNQKLAEKFIDHSIKERNKYKKQESRIEISADIMEQIKKKHIYSKQKGRALLMLVTDKEIYKINRKRKRENTLPTSQHLKSQRNTKLRD